MISIFQLDKQYIIEKPKPMILSNTRIPENQTIKHLFDVTNAVKKQLQSQIKISEGWRIKYAKLQKQFSAFNKSLGNYLSKEQIETIQGKKNVKWSNGAIKKGLLLKIRGGSRVLNYVRKKVIPLPSVPTINRSVSELNFSSGICEFNLEVLKAKCESFKPAERRFGLCFDEKALIPGIRFDPKTQKPIGKPTMALSSKVDQNQLASHGLVFLIMGMEPRIKEIVAFEYTGSSTCGIAMKKYIFDLIIHVENVSNVYIDFLSIDISPVNCSFLKECGINMTKKNEVFYIEHPNDSSRKLFIKPDDIHNLKNQISGIRKHKIKISKKLVDEFSLSSSVANFNDIEKVYSAQKNAAYKFAKNLTRVVMKPDHFEIMREENATRLVSSDVSQAINLLSNNQAKKNPMCFVLESIEKFHKITTNTVGYRLDEQEIFESDVEFLNFMINVFYQNITYEKAFLKSIPAAVISIKTLIEYSRFLFSIGIKKVVPSRMLSNAIENIFSMTTSKSCKPSAYEFQNLLKSISITGYDNEAVVGSSYSLDSSSETSKIDFLAILKDCIQNGNCVKMNSSDDENSDIIELIDVPLSISLDSILHNILEIHAYEREMDKLALTIKPKIACLDCLNLHFCADNSLSSITKDLFAKLEYIFVRILATVIPDDSIFREIFILSVENLDIFHHCVGTKKIFAKFFFAYRLKLSLSCRFIHRANKLESRSFK